MAGMNLVRAEALVFAGEAAYTTGLRQGRNGARA